MDKTHGLNSNTDILFTKMFVAEDHIQKTWQKILTIYSQNKYMLMARRQTATFKAKESSLLKKKESIYNTVAPQPSSNKFENDDYWAPS
jgi:hypothetical protein